MFKSARRTIEPPPGRLIELFYKHIQDGTFDTLYLPSSHAYYVWSLIHKDPKLIEALGGRSPTFLEVERAMYEEGLLPAHYYGIPHWFKKKYGFK